MNSRHTGGIPLGSTPTPSQGHTSGTESPTAGNNSNSSPISEEQRLDMIMGRYTWLQDADEDTLDRIASSVDYLEELFQLTRHVSTRKMAHIGLEQENRRLAQENVELHSEVVDMSTQEHRHTKELDTVLREISQLVEEEKKILSRRNHRVLHDQIERSMRELDDRSESMFQDFVTRRGEAADGGNGSISLDAFVAEMRTLRAQYHERARLLDAIRN